MSPKNTTPRIKGLPFGLDIDDRDNPATINAAAMPALYGRGTEGTVAANQMKAAMSKLMVAHIESRPPAR